MKTSKGNAECVITLTGWAIVLHWQRCKLLLVVGCMLASLPSFAGSVIAWGSGLGTNVPPTLTNVASIAAGSEHCVVLLTDGSVSAWGNNSYSQTNVPDGLSNVVAIAAGGEHSLALRSDGTVINWGKYSDGSAYSTMTIPADRTNIVAIAAGSDHDLLLKNDGTVSAWGLNDDLQTVVPG